MKTLAYILVGFVLGSAVTATVMLWWAHQIYTVGVDVNLKAIVVGFIGLLLLAGAGFVAHRLVRRRHSRES